MQAIRTLRIALMVTASLMLGPVLAAGDGAKVFKQVCAVCHGKQGQGTPGLAPPLQASSFVTETDAQALAEFLQNGRAGADKKFPDYASPMPPYNGGKDKALAVAEYIKTDLQQ